MQRGLPRCYSAAKLRLAARIKELYYDLFLAHKTIDILKERTDLFSRVEDAATARYASGMGSQQEVVMAQTEKYMLLEKEEMQKTEDRGTPGHAQHDHRQGCQQPARPSRRGARDVVQLHPG